MECPLNGINESCDPAKNDGGANQAEKHSAHEVLKKLIILSWFLNKGSKSCAQNGQFSLIIGKYLFASGLEFNRMNHFFEGFSPES